MSFHLSQEQVDYIGEIECRVCLEVFVVTTEVCPICNRRVDQKEELDRYKALGHEV